MKRAISIILNILSVVSAVLLLVVGAFCIFDIISFSSSPFAWSIDFWLAMRIYIKFLFAFSIIGIIASTLDFVVLPESRSKAFKLFLFVLFIVAFVAAIVLTYFSYNF